MVDLDVSRRLTMASAGLTWMTWPTEAAERISTVMTFTGQALKPPPGAAVLLQFSDTALSLSALA
jgi:hypothetical protein